MLGQNLKEFYVYGKKINEISKIKIYDSAVLATKLQKEFRFEPNFAIESVKFSYNGWHSKPKHIQKLWQEQIESYNRSEFSRLPATASYFCPTVYDCHLSNAGEYYAENNLDDIINYQLMQNVDNNTTKQEALKRVQEDIVLDFLNSIYARIRQLSSNRTNNGKINVVSIPPIKYNTTCPAYFAIAQDVVPVINSMLSDFCAQHNINFINTFPHLADQDGHIKEGLSNDGVSLNEKGYDSLTRVLSSKILKLERNQNDESHLQ